MSSGNALSWIGGIVGAIGVLWGAYNTYVGGRRTGANDTAQTDLATVRAAADEWRAMKADTQSQLDESRRRLSAAEADIVTLKAQYAAQERQLHEVIEDRQQLVDYLRAFWRWAVGGALPPPPPVPDHLHDILDPNEWHWPSDQ